MLRVKKNKKKLKKMKPSCRLPGIKSIKAKKIGNDFEITRRFLL